MKKKRYTWTGTYTQINRFRNFQSNQNRYPDLYYYCYCEPILLVIVMSTIILLYSCHIILYIVSIHRVHICKPPRISKILRFISLPLRPFVSVRFRFVYTADCVIRFVVSNNTRLTTHNASIVRLYIICVLWKPETACAVVRRQTERKSRRWTEGGSFLILDFSTDPRRTCVFILTRHLLYWTIRSYIPNHRLGF